MVIAVTTEAAAAVLSMERKRTDIALAQSGNTNFNNIFNPIWVSLVAQLVKNLPVVRKTSI